MAGVNKVIILGRLGQDPELRMTTNNQQVCSFSVATSENWTSKEGKREERTEWHRVVLWGRQAELAHKYLRKGRQVYLEGKLQTRSWDDNQGQKRYTTEIVANQISFIDSGNSRSSENENAGHEFQGNTDGYSDNGQASQTNNNSFQSNSSSVMMDDVPF